MIACNGQGANSRDSSPDPSLPHSRSQVLARVMKHRSASTYFNRPVDPEALGIPTYRNVVLVREPRFPESSSIS